MKLRIRIGDKYVGNEEPVFIIAEAGVNHNGSVELARQMIDVAAAADVEAVKFQTFKTERLTTKDAKMAEYQKEIARDRDSQYDLIKHLELPYDAFVELSSYCNKKGITFLSTPHTRDAVDYLEPLVPAYKIGSGDLTNHPFLRAIALKGKPLILSTGMATLEEVREAVDVILSEGNERIILLHCVTNYPADIRDVNLRAILTLKNTFNLPVGFSDHTMGISASIAAVTLGACVLEKHFTLDRELPGPDHKASLEPQELRELVDTIRSIQTALGDGKKQPTSGEEYIKDIVRKSIVARVDISKGATITENMIEIKRPGHGIPPKHLHELIGKKTKVKISADQLLSWDMIE